uniref:Ulp1 protease family, C-terminal catalytic domain-containing protein n=1 Tax=Tanacetum cinerariifolium TaxID=118510 RepID=A0A6L2L6W5_TANCI|nr:hypothetical protein [Tanacetum cinerariifolium]
MKNEIKDDETSHNQNHSLVCVFFWWKPLCEEVDGLKISKPTSAVRTWGGSEAGSSGAGSSSSNMLRTINQKIVRIKGKRDGSRAYIIICDFGGLLKDKKNYKKSSKVNEVLQPKPSHDAKSFVRQLPKEVSKEKSPVKSKVARVESNVGKRKRLVKDKEVEDEHDSDVDGSDGESDFDKEHKVIEEADVSNESEEEGKGIKTKAFKCKEKIVVSKFKKQNKEVEDERDSDVKGSDRESDYDKEHKGSEEADLSNESEEEGGLLKDKKNYKKSSKVNEVLQPKPSHDAKSFVRRLPKEVSKEKSPVKSKVARVESNVGKRKRLVKDKEVEDEHDSDVDGSDGESDFDKEHKVIEEADVSNESEEEGKVVSKFKKQNKEVEDERDSDVKGSDGESDSDKEHKGSEEADLSNESEEEGKGVKTMVFKGVKNVKIKGVKGNKTVVVSKAKKRKHVSNSSSEDEKVSKPKKVSKKKNQVKDVKKRKHVSDSSSEEEKVSKPKKVSKKKNQVKDVKKRKHVSDSSSSYNESSSLEEEKVSKPKKVFKKKKQVKDLKKKQVKNESSSSEDEKPLKNKKRLKHVKDVKKKKKPLTAEQIKKIEYLSDLPCLHSRTVPFSLFASIRDSQVDMESFLSNIGFSSFHNILIDTLPQRFERFVVRAFSAYSYEFKLEKGIIRIQTLRELISVASYTNVFKEVQNRRLGGFYIGPLCFLIEQDIGRLDLHGAWTDSELDQTEGFYDVGVGDNVSRTRKSSVSATDKRQIRCDFHFSFYFLQGFCGMIEDKISIIYAEKIALEDLFKRANVEFANDGKVIELYEKYIRIFKEYVIVEDFQVHIHDFDNNDDDGGGKNDNHGSDFVGKKKELAGKEVVNDKKDGVNAEKDDVNAEKDGVNVIQEGEADVNEEPEHMLEEETFAQKICLCGLGLFNRYQLSILNHEELVRGFPSPKRHFFPTRCNTKAIIKGTTDEEQQWKVLSNEISSQFKHDVSSISLSEVNLSPSAMIILDNSNYGETYNSKYKAVCEPLSTTKNHSDCGVFTMIHLENYLGKPVGQWDFGLCEESDEQVLMLRRMRFNIATKILFHEFNVHAEKMFDLAFKCESENDEQTRISIIVNAIKNRDERDPAKTKTC